MKKTALPQYIKSCLWSYDIHEMDIMKAKELIIQQALNHGNWEAIKWILRMYNEEEINNVLQHPRRGVWFEDVLNFWEQMLNIRIDPKLRKRAIMDINPDPDYKLLTSKT